MKAIARYFDLSIIFTVIAASLGFYLGGTTGLCSVLILGVLETSLSLDNAVVNAGIIGKMDAFWRKMFLTVGMVIAVFGMRIVFPLLIVSCTTSMGMLDAAKLALEKPAEYATALTGAHVMIAGFGGAFLMMVFLKFFMDEEKDTHWLSWIEKPLASLGHIEAIQILLTIASVYFASTRLIGKESHELFMSGIAGVLTYIVVDSLEIVIQFIVGTEEEEQSSAQGMAVTLAKAGLGTFLYLEVLDASFSFDGVIGAFAISTDVVIIGLGLGIGAMFVRSMTILAVEKNMLAEFQFLEHGAFYAIGSLAAMMFLGTFMHISEVVSGLLGAGILGVSLMCSIVHKRNNIEQAEVVGA